jgi:hypothetical protein
VRDLNRLELAGETVRACVEAIAAVDPDWLAATIDLDGWGRRYGARVDSWRPPTSKAKRDALATDYDRDGFALLKAVYAPGTPRWVAHLPAVETPRVVLVQQYTVDVDRQGREVIRRREASTDGLPPGRLRVTSPYDLDARWGGKRDLTWNGYKIHVSESRDVDAADLPASTTDWVPDTPPNLITHVATTDASVPDVAMTEPIHEALARRRVLPAEHYVDSGYPSADLLLSSLARFGVTLVTPMLADTSPQARAAEGFDRTAFTIDWDQRQVTCPQGQGSTSWAPATQRGTEVIVTRFDRQTCQQCPVRAQCTTATRTGRQLTPRPQPVQEALDQARAEQATAGWQARYALRAGAESTIAQAVKVTDTRHARYRGLPKTRLEHVYKAVAINLIRLDAWWHGIPLDRRQTSHLSRLELALAA